MSSDDNRLVPKMLNCGLTTKLINAAKTMKDYQNVLNAVMTLGNLTFVNDAAVEVFYH
jgi:hypothetical protein